MIVLIIVVVAFVNRAGELDLNKWKWGAIGFATYGGVQILMGVLAALAMDMQGETITDSSDLVFNIVAIIVSGIIAYTVYNKMPIYVAQQKQERREDLLDEDMFR